MISPLWKVAIGLSFIALGGFGTVILKQAWDEFNVPPPNIAFRRVAFYWVKLDTDIFQIGAVVRLYNLGDKAYLLNGIALDASAPSTYGRGVAYLRKFFFSGSRAEIIDDNFIKPSSEATFKLLLPIKFEATIEHPPPPGIVFVGQWSLLLGETHVPVDPEFFGTFDRIISFAEWASIANFSAPIELENISYQRSPPKVSDGATESDFVLFNPDRSANYQVFGFAQVPAARGEAGTIVYVRGKGAPPLDGGWTVLGRSYEEVWADAEKRTLYNSIFPPSDTGEPRPVGLFQ